MEKWIGGEEEEKKQTPATESSKEEASRLRMLRCKNMPESSLNIFGRLRLAHFVLIMSK